jgi:3'(2'), 5'-bisphosphate nucleotidase
MHPKSYKVNIIDLTDIAIQAAIRAGEKITDVYSSVDFNIQFKKDNTPVTIADRNAHDEIVKILEITQLPVLSEEGIHLSFDERKDWDLFWLVDPLDGTKEFIKRNDEFTVNIALIQKNTPIAGVIYAPVTGELFVGIPETGAWKLINPPETCTFQFMQQSGEKLPAEKISSEYIIAISRSHINPETLEYIEKLRKIHRSFKLINMGSSLKICRIAEGNATIYPKLGQTMEWDTAAGHAIVKAAGKNIYLTDLKTELSYNKENLQNPHFIVV